MKTILRLSSPVADLYYGILFDSLTLHIFLTVEHIEQSAMFPRLFSGPNWVPLNSNVTLNQRKLQKSGAFYDMFSEAELPFHDE